MKRILITGAAGFWDHIYVTVLLKKVILLLAWIIWHWRLKNIEHLFKLKILNLSSIPEHQNV
jgi:hypothetical protein